MMQQEEIELSEGCGHKEVNLPDEWICDFVSLIRTDRKKQRDRKMDFT